MSAQSSDHIIPTEFIEALESSDFMEFLRETGRSSASLLTVTLPVAPIDPLAALELNPDYDEKYYWDHPRNGIAIAAAGKVRELKATGSNRFADISGQTVEMKNDLDAYTAIHHSMAGPIFLGGYSFSDHNVGKTWKKFGAGGFVLPEWMVVRDGALHLLTLTIDKSECTIDEIYEKIISRITQFITLSSVTEGESTEPDVLDNILCSLQSTDDKGNWIKRVNRAKEMIADGEFEKIVLARSVTVQSRKKPSFTVLSHQLRQKYPECFNFLVQKDHDTAFIGATPERLASFRSGIFKTEGLAGSTSRGQSALEDATLARDLMESRKDRDEHNFVVKAIHDNLSKFSYRIEHPRQPAIKKLKNVQHLFTPISASIKKGVQIHDLISEMHPTPAVGGFPRDEAIAHINDIEQIERGWYAAPVGWFNLSGSGEFAVAIRSALLHENRATLYAGCGIVADSDPETEWNETLLKFRPMLDSLNRIQSHG